MVERSVCLLISLILAEITSGELTTGVDGLQHYLAIGSISNKRNGEHVIVMDYHIDLLIWEPIPVYVVSALGCWIESYKDCM